MVVDLTDPNRPRFTMQELKEVLQERNQLKAQLMVAQEELQLYKRYRPLTFICTSVFIKLPVLKGRVHNFSSLS